MARRQRRKLNAEINVVPYIDVMLVLLVIFMVTAPLLMQGVEVELPEAAAKPVVKADEEPLIVSIKQDGTLFLNIGGEQQALAEDELYKKIAIIMRRNQQKPVVVWGDKRVPYGRVVSLMAGLQGAGVPNVGLATEAP
jgi:biopolymer transport protein TolR